MTDLTDSLSTILSQKHSTKAISKDAARLQRSLDSFLQEAHQINTSINSLLTYLRAIRKPYLSTAPPPRRNQTNRRESASHVQYVPGFGEIPSYLNDGQREDIDSRTSILLRDINGNISNLSSAESLQHNTATKVLEKKYGRPNNILWRWAAGDGDSAADGEAGKSSDQVKEEGEVKSKHMVREGVLWYLNKGLKDVVGVQQEMIEVRLEREREKRASVLYDERNKNVTLERREEETLRDYDTGDLRGHDTFNAALEGGGVGDSTLSELSPEQLQLFEQENDSLVRYYTDTLAKVTQAEKSLIEISSLQQTLVGHLTVQGEMIGQLVEDASRTDENVRRGNKELKRASERGGTARAVFFGTVGLCSFLIVWDLIF